MVPQSPAAAVKSLFLQVFTRFSGGVISGPSPYSEFALVYSFFFF